MVIAKLDRILFLLTSPVRIVVTVKNNKFKGEDDMDTVKATVDFQLQDNGTVKFTAKPVDAKGFAATLPAGTPPLSWVSSDPALVLSADPDDNSGFALSQIGTPAGLATGVVVTGSTTLPGAVEPISGSANPVDIIAGPVSGFAVTEA